MLLLLSVSPRLLSFTKIAYLHFECLLELKDVFLTFFQLKPQSLHVTQFTLYGLGSNFNRGLRLEGKATKVIHSTLGEVSENIHMNEELSITKFSQFTVF